MTTETQFFEVTTPNVLERPQAFRFLWDAFFGNRKRLKLSQEDVQELEGLEAVTKPWEQASERLNSFRMSPDGMFHQAVEKLLAEPSERNVEGVLNARWTPPFTSLQLSIACDQLTGLIVTRQRELLAPVVRRHLKRIHAELKKEVAEQITADQKALQRLGEGTARGGESEACRILRERTDQVGKFLEGEDSPLANWREVLGPFLP
jgi:hypothetical protein